MNAYISYVRDFVTLTTSIWWILLFLLLLLIMGGVSIQVSGALLIFLALYSLYLWRYSLSAPEIPLHIDIKDITDMEELKETLQIIERKWTEIGAPENIVREIDLIQLLYSLLPWRYYNEGAYIDLIDQCDRFFSSHFDRRELRRDVLRNFDAAFSSYPGYEEVQPRLASLLPYSMCSE